MNNIGHTLYTSIVHYAEGGERVFKVVLPADLFSEYQQEQGMVRMMSTLGVEVVAGNVKAPKFFSGESK